MRLWFPPGRGAYLHLAVLGAGLGSWWVVSDDRSPAERALIGVPINVAALLALSRATRRAHVATFVGATGVSMAATLSLRRAAWLHENDWPP